MMRNLKFKYARAENFLCFGEEGIELNFEEYGNIVCIKGKNFDVNSENAIEASNACGKSAMIEVIIYALYGKTIKKPKKLNHVDLINNQSDNKLTVEVIWDNHRVVRTRKGETGTLQLWESNEAIWNKKTEITLSGIPATQKEIEKIIGLTYESFINIFVFSDDNTLAFLECDNTKKREIVENILSLERYRNYSVNTKDLLKNLKDKIKDLTKEYELLLSQKETAASRLIQIETQEKDWYNQRKKELDNIHKEIKLKRDELDKTKTGTALANYQEAQEQIAELKEKLPILEDRKVKLNDLLVEITTKLSTIDTKITTTEVEFTKIKAEYDKNEKTLDINKRIIEDIEKKTGKECPYCLSFINEKNFSDIIKKAKDVLGDVTPNYISVKEKYEAIKIQKINLLDIKRKIDAGIIDFKGKLNKINAEITEIHCDISKLSKIKKPDTDLNDALLYEQIESLKKQSVEKQSQLDGLTPFDNIKKTAITDLSNKIKDGEIKKEEIRKLEDEVPYYEFWVKAFGDSGIRKYVIDGIIPTLNDQIEYWLQFLIDNKIKLTFNNELEDTIDRYPFNGRPYIYHGMSGGQRRRLNLTVAAAWAFISSLNSGASPSVIFLDEVTMNMDIVGVQGIYRMICELAKEKQVFVIDHSELLLQMLDGCDTIYLEMRDEISKKVT